MADALRFQILGPLEAYAGDRPLPLGPLKQRLVLGLLLCRANSVVPVAALCETLWDGDPPRTAHKNLQVYVSAVRRLAGAAHLRYHPPGYAMRLAPDQLDALRFGELARAGQHAGRDGNVEAAADLLGQAVRMWRGPVLPELSTAETLAAEARRLRERYLAAYEDWVEAKLALGQHAELLDGIDDLARAHPFRERLRHAQMLSLYRSGRQTEALAHFEEMRQQLARELGLAPSPVLLRLYERILSTDPGLDPRTLATARAGGPRRGLPRAIGDFTGRTGEVRTLLDLFDGDERGAVAVISGPAGVGKTAMAVHCAYRLAGRFPDGQLLVRLREPDGGPRAVPELLADLLRWLGPAGVLPRTEAERSALLRESTAGRRVLVVLDDAAAEAQVRAVLTTVVDGSVIVTSRRHLVGLESAVRLDLPPMTGEEAMTLLGSLVGAGRVAAEPAAARRITAACDGLPLAIRVVGAKLAGLRHVPLTRYAERLADEDRLLDELAAGDLEVRARLGLSYRDLEPADQATLHRLAHLPEPVFGTAEAAAALGVGGAAAEVALERLIDAGLVEGHAPEVEAHAAGDGATYSLSPLIRVFVRERGSR